MWRCRGRPWRPLFMAGTAAFLCIFVRMEGTEAGNTDWLNNCNDHGIFSSTTLRCACFDGWGSATDISDFKDPACAFRVCPPGKRWHDVPSATNTAHQLAECSGVGLCDRNSGECQCPDGYGGRACDRLDCPKFCSGHGDCMSMTEMASMTNVLPLTTATTYRGAASTTTWDERKGHACVCDSSWTVGLGSGERQLSEWYGPECNLRRCPSGDDPMTTTDETDCNGKSANGASTASPTGASGNLCHIECSNRGTCNNGIGVCECFPGFTGSACEIQDALSGGSSST